MRIGREAEHSLAPGVGSLPQEVLARFVVDDVPIAGRKCDTDFCAGNRTSLPSTTLTGIVRAAWSTIRAAGRVFPGTYFKDPIRDPVSSLATRIA